MKRLLILVVLGLPVFGSITSGQEKMQARDSLSVLKEEFQSLSRMFETLNAGDTVYSPFFPTWSVRDRGLKLRILSAFRNHDIPVDQNEPVIIIATPDQQEIADIRIGKASFGRMYAKFVLSQDLHQAILARHYELRMEVPAGYQSE